MQSKAKNKLFCKSTQINKNKSQIFKHGRYSNIIKNKNQNNDEYYNMVSNPPCIDYNNASEMLKEIDDLQIINGSLMNQI